MIFLLNFYLHFLIHLFSLCFFGALFSFHSRFQGASGGCGGGESSSSSSSSSLSSTAAQTPPQAGSSNDQYWLDQQREYEGWLTDIVHPRANQENGGHVGDHGEDEFRKAVVTWTVTQALTKNIAECDDCGKFKEVVAYDLGKIVNPRDGPEDIEKVCRRLTQEETMALPGLGYFDIGVGDPDQLANVVASLDVHLSGANSYPASTSTSYRHRHISYVLPDQSGQAVMREISRVVKLRAERTVVNSMHAFLSSTSSASLNDDDGDVIMTAEEYGKSQGGSTDSVSSLNDNNSDVIMTERENDKSQGASSAADASSAASSSSAASASSAEATKSSTSSSTTSSTNSSAADDCIFRNGDYSWDIWTDDAKIKLYGAHLNTETGPVYCHRDNRQFTAVEKALSLLWVARCLWSFYGGWTLLAINGRWVMLWKPANMALMFFMPAASCWHKAVVCLPPKAGDTGPKKAAPGTYGITHVYNININLGKDLDVNDWREIGTDIISQCSSKDFSIMLKDVTQYFGSSTPTSTTPVSSSSSSSAVVDNSGGSGGSGGSGESGGSDGSDGSDGSGVTGATGAAAAGAISSSSSLLLSAVEISNKKTSYEQQQRGMDAVVSVALARKHDYISDQDSPEVTRGKLHWKIATLARELNVDVTFKDATDLKELEECAQRLKEQYEMQMIEDLEKVIVDWGNVNEMQVVDRLRSPGLVNTTCLNGLASCVARINVQKRRGRNSVRGCGVSAIGCEAMNCQQLDDAVVTALVNFLRADTSISDYHKKFVGAAGQYPGSSAQ